MRAWRLFLLASATLLWLVGLAGAAFADHCGSPSDCFGTAGSFTQASWGLIALGTLSLTLDLIPGIGTAKGIVESVTGEDLVTGAELEPWERALGVVPFIGALGALKYAGRLGDVAGDSARAGRSGDALRRFDTADHPDLRDLPRKPTPNRTAADRFEIEQTGPDNFLFRDGGEQIWVDGYRAGERFVLDAKHVGNSARSPFVEDSAIPPFIRDKILKEVEDEFRRYAAVVGDRNTLPQGLEIRTNTEAARPFFEDLLSRYNIPGRVVVVPPS